MAKVTTVITEENEMRKEEVAELKCWFARFWLKLVLLKEPDRVQL